MASHAGHGNSMIVKAKQEQRYAGTLIELPEMELAFKAAEVPVTALSFVEIQLP
jgi:hypothetical protein